MRRAPRSAEEVAVSILDAADRSLRWTGTFPCLLQVHLLAEDTRDPYLGRVTARRRRTGQDTAEAIADLGRQPSVRAADRLVIAWEDTELHAALELPTDATTGCLVTVDASRCGAVVTRRPVELRLSAMSFLGVPGAAPVWGKASRVDTELAVGPVIRLLSAWWHPVSGLRRR